jgi:lysozyme
MALGIDVSHWQGMPDFNKVKAEGLDFVYIKSTDGVKGCDPLAVQHGTSAKAAGLKIGYYHFAEMNDPGVLADAESEANAFATMLGKLPAYDILPVLDIETNKSNLSPELVREWIGTFIDTMKQKGIDIMLYSYAPFLDQYLPVGHTFGNVPLWIAQYKTEDQPTLPRGWTTYMLWQYSNQGTVDGVQGLCDVNKGSDDLLTSVPQT